MAESGHAAASSTTSVLTAVESQLAVGIGARSVREVVKSVCFAPAPSTSERPGLRVGKAMKRGGADATRSSTTDLKRRRTFDALGAFAEADVTPDSRMRRASGQSHMTTRPARSKTVRPLMDDCHAAEDTKGRASRGVSYGCGRSICGDRPLGQVIG